MRLFRPIGLTELGRILDLDARAFPPRLSWQPIFYPVLNAEYARQIAREWNCPDEFSGYCGFVTSFEVADAVASRYPVQNVGGRIHDELWVPSEALEEFNAAIIGCIQVEESYYGPLYKGDVGRSEAFAGLNAAAQWEVLVECPSPELAALIGAERWAIQANFAYWSNLHAAHPHLIQIAQAFTSHYPETPLPLPTV